MLSHTHYVVSKKRKFLENQYATEHVQHKCVDNIQCNMCHYPAVAPGTPPSSTRAQWNTGTPLAAAGGLGPATCGG